jgi:hypothetical protein
MDGELRHGGTKEAAIAATYAIFNRNYELLKLVVTPTKQTTEVLSTRNKIVTPIRAD